MCVCVILGVHTVRTEEPTQTTHPSSEMHGSPTSPPLQGATLLEFVARRGASPSGKALYNTSPSGQHDAENQPGGREARRGEARRRCTGPKTGPYSSYSMNKRTRPTTHLHTVQQSRDGYSIPLTCAMSSFEPARQEQARKNGPDFAIVLLFFSNQPANPCLLLNIRRSWFMTRVTPITTCGHAAT